MPAPSGGSDRSGWGIYGLLELKDDPDGFLHLVRTVF